MPLPPGRARNLHPRNPARRRPTRRIPARRIPARRGPPDWRTALALPPQRDPVGLLPRCCHTLRSQETADRPPPASLDTPSLGQRWCRLLQTKETRPEAAMRAVVIEEPGGPEVLKLREVADPVPAVDEVLITIAAAGVNRADLMQRQGLYPPPPGAPPYPGLECAGQIAAVGSQVTGWRLGDNVCALLAGGGYAEQVAVPTGQVLPWPAGKSPLAEAASPAEAAALPEAACTVYANVFLQAGLQPGETLLVHGGASGIGTMAIQLAKAAGARVACTAGSQQKLARCRELGADIAISYRDEDFVTAVLAFTGGQGADVI